MDISIGIIVSVLVTQNSLQESVNSECHPDISRGIICPRKEAMDKSESRENLRFNNRKAYLNNPDRTHESSSTEDVIANYESIQNFPEKNDNSQAIGEVRTEYLRNFQDQNYEPYSDGRELDSSENRRISNENEEDESYKSPESLSIFSDFSDTSDSKSKSEALYILRNALNKNRNSVKYDSYEHIRDQLDKSKWHMMPLKTEKRFLGALARGVGQIAIELGVGQLIDKIFN